MPNHKDRKPYPTGEVLTAAQEIKEMKTTGSSEVAAKGAESLRSLLDLEYENVAEFERHLRRNSEQLTQVKPFHASLQTTQREIRSRALEDATDVDEVVNATRTAIDSVIEQIESRKRRAAENAVELLDDGEKVLTHDYSTTILQAIEHAVEKDRSLTVYATEARPRCLGRETARKLGPLDGVDLKLVVDGAAGWALEDCDRVLLGMNCIAGNRLYNRVGTRLVAADAHLRNVPVAAVGSSSKIVDPSFEFEPEDGPKVAVFRERAEHFNVVNRPYDATPIDWLDSIITENGRLAPEDVR